MLGSLSAESLVGLPKKCMVLCSLKSHMKPSNLAVRALTSQARGPGFNSRVGREAGAVIDCGHFMWLDDLQSQTTQTFCIDKKADPANWEYKSLYRGDLARYKRKGDECLGLDARKHRIIWGDSSRKKKEAQKKDYRYYSKSGLQLLSTDTVSVCRRDGSSGETKLAPSCSSFIPVPDWEEADGKNQGTCALVNPLGVYDASTTLWLQGKGQLEHTEKDQGPPENSENTGLATMTKVERFNRTLRENPADIQTWMEFVHFQDELLKGPSPYQMCAADTEKRKRSVRVLLEKKLAILDRAIESNPGSVELKVARLVICQEFWEPASLVNEWKKVVFLHPNDASLWQRYLLFCQGQFSTFSVSKVNGIYGKCLTTLAASLDGTLVSHPTLPDTEEAMLGIFLQQCHYLRQSGHSEKAIALFQALIDFTFFRPDHLTTLLTKTQVEFFEPFWDSGEPRFGEKGARGWKAWMRQQERGGWLVTNEQGDEDEEDEVGDEVKDKSLPKWQVWLQVESSRDAKHWLPWRAEEAKGKAEEECDDPDRQVLFDDIGTSMFKISTPELRFRLMTSFFQFLGIPMGFSLPASCLNVTLDELSVFGSETPGERPLTSLDLQSSGVSAVGSMGTVAYQKKPIARYKEGEDFIQTAFHQALPLFTAEEQSELTLSWLQYERAKVTRCLRGSSKKLRSQGRKSRRLARRLLKETENRSDLALWKEYAHLEWLLGNVEDSRKVFDAALATAVSQGLQSSPLCGLCLLYAALELELMGGLDGAASCRTVYILTKLAEGSNYAPYPGDVSPVGVLKARKAFEQSFRECLTASGTASGTASPCEPGPQRLANLSGCYALFQYLTVGVQGAEALYSRAAQSLPPPPSGRASAQGRQWATSELGRMSTFHAGLLRYNMQVSVHPLGPLRNVLTGALRRDPSNAGLWRLYAQAENRSHSASRARRFFDSTARAAKGLILPWLFAIYAEERRKALVDCVHRVDVGLIHTTLPETGLANRIRTLFEHGLHSESGAHCVLLWRMYLRFMVTQGNAERSKGVFYRALQACPWAKVLYLDAIEYFPEQLQEIVDLMTEKEIRVRVPIEELEILLEEDEIPPETEARLSCQ
uniref:NRDE-2, necessary for RNA interference, domain containing n=1 Tax=Callorhinchus milii TaxID=7868 RepID=A0A4W3JGF6_CALMI